jgi:hypothetical protein
VPPDPARPRTVLSASPSVDDSATAGRTALVPLTERILNRLGRGRRLWILVWALIPLVSPFVYGAAIRLTGGSLDTRQFADLLATQVGVAWACFVLLWGVGVLARRATAVRDELTTRTDAASLGGLFRAVESVAAPIALTAVPAVVITASGWLRYGAQAPLAALPPLVAYLVPIVTFVWVYVTILSELDRLGGQPLVLDQFPQDRTLGLEGVGSLASTGLVFVLAAAAPVLFVGSDEPATLGVALSIVAISVGLFLLSMWRLHRQMVGAKARFVALSRRLYEEAYAPVRAAATVDALESQAAALRAAQSLEERAQALMTWPIDESTLRFIAVVVTGVITSLLVRAVLAAMGV